MRRYRLAVTCPALLSGCAIQSISNPGRPGAWAASNAPDRGRISEFDVGGFGAGPAAERGRWVRLAAGVRVLVIQSRVLFPDQGMLDVRARHCRVGAIVTERGTASK